MSVADWVLGDAPRDGRVHLKVSEEELHKREVSLLQAAFVAAAVIVVAMYVSDNLDPAVVPVSDEQRTLAAPLF